MATSNTYRIDSAAVFRDPMEAKQRQMRQRLKPKFVDHTDNSRNCYRVVKTTTEDGHVSMHAEHGVLNEDGSEPTRWTKLCEAAAGDRALDVILTVIDQDYRRRVRTTEYFTVEPINGN